MYSSPGSPGSTFSRAAAGVATIISDAAAIPLSSLHVRVIGSSPAFGRDPVDVLGRVLDVAGLAVDAILGVDLQARLAIGFLDKLINSRGAITLLGSGIDRQVDRGRYVGILERQMNRLVFLVIGVRDEDRGETIERQHAV